MAQRYNSRMTTLCRIDTAERPRRVRCATSRVTLAKLSRATLKLRR